MVMFFNWLDLWLAVTIYLVIYLFIAIYSQQAEGTRLDNQSWRMEDGCSE